MEGTNGSGDMNDLSSVATTANMTVSTDFNRNMDEFRNEMRSEIQEKMEVLQQENLEIKKSFNEFKYQCEINQAKQETSLDRIEKFMMEQCNTMVEQKANYDLQFAQLNSMFMMFMSTQMKGQVEENFQTPVAPKRKLTTVQIQQTIGNELPNDK
jgi:hypothetical protein